MKPVQGWAAQLGVDLNSVTLVINTDFADSEGWISIGDECQFSVVKCNVLFFHKCTLRI